MLQTTLNSLEKDLTIDDPTALSNLISAIGDRKTAATGRDREPYPFLTSLRSLLDWFPQSDVTATLGTFVSGNDDDREFLIGHSIGLEMESISRTYLLMDPLGHLRVCGYFTLGTSHLSIAGERFSDLALPGALLGEQCVPTYAVWKICAGKECPVSASEILSYAMAMIASSSHRTGCRLVRSDCVRPDTKLFEDAGFRFIRTDRNGERDQLLLVL